ARRAVRVPVGGRNCWAAIEDVGRLRDGLGVPPPPGTPDAFRTETADPLGDLVGRYARTHGPFEAEAVAAQLGLGIAVVQDVLRRLAADDRVVEGEFTPGTTGVQWCDTGVLRRLRRRSLAALRHEVEPVDPAALARFLPAWQHVRPPRRPGNDSADTRPASTTLRGVDGVLSVVEQLAGIAVPASALEPLVLASRVSDYAPTMLDELTASGA